MLLLYVKTYGNVINLNIYALKVLISDILLKKYYSTMRVEKKTLKSDHNWFIIAILSHAQLVKD